MAKRSLSFLLEEYPLFDFYGKKVVDLEHECSDSLR
jgi:hypothetical protein